jgi:hypothetical protein
MNNYYFTFGQDHCNNNGELMRAYWVRVIAPDYAAARELFVTCFMSIHMPRKDHFATQYEEKHFIKKFFPRGEFTCLGGAYNKIQG